MSSIYIQEPPTKGNVVLHTTLGDVEFELWSKETPKACRNFVQLCLEGYYDNTIFHRVVRGFVVQGGDPTGTGENGESIYGEPFEDEFHSRLRFVRRGLVGMASTGPHTNRSQFFITLDRADELTKVNTLFATVAGDTIFNVLKVGELELDGERPIYPPRIISTEVVLNPFEDLIPRITAAEKRFAEEKAQRRAQEMPKKRTKEKKNVILLSFGEEAEELEAAEASSRMKIKSSHELLEDDPTLISESAVSVGQMTREASILEKVKQPMKERNLAIRSAEEPIDGFDSDDRMTGAEYDAMMRDRVKRKHRIEDGDEAEAEADRSDKKQKGDGELDVKTKISLMRKEIRDLERSRDMEKRETKDKEMEKVKEKASYVEQERERYLKNKRPVIAVGKKKVHDERETLERLKAFTAKLWEAPEEEYKAPAEKLPIKGEVGEGDLYWKNKPCGVHGVKGCQSCRDTFGEKGEESEEGWLSHQLMFQKEPGVKRDDLNNYEVIDTRERARQAAQEEAQRKQKARAKGASAVFRTDHRQRALDRDREENRQSKLSSHAPSGPPSTPTSLSSGRNGQFNRREHSRN